MPTNATCTGPKTHILAVAVALGALTVPSWGRDGSGAAAAESRDREAEAARQLAQAQDRRVVVAVGGRQFAITVAASCRVRQMGDRTRIVCPPHTRSPKTILLAPVGPRSPKVPAKARSRALGAGRSLTYWITRHEGGSGGREVFLFGRLRIEKTTLAVTCGGQGEFSRPPADWCVPYLRTLRPK